MADFEQSYPSEHSPEDLWRVINTPLLDPDIASLVHEDFDVSYKDLSTAGQIELGTLITYVATNEAVQKVPIFYRGFIPQDATFYVTRMDIDYRPGESALRHDVLMSDKYEGSVTRTIEEADDGSRLVVAATLSVNGLGNALDGKIIKALGYGVGEPSERTIALADDILAI